MFQSKNNRYVTRSVDNTVPIETQFFLWSLIDDQVQNGNEMDYFQKFELKATENGQLVVHGQEEPDHVYLRRWEEEDCIPDLQLLEEEKVHCKVPAFPDYDH